ncbi:UDP-2,4-diacetamido-2,4,6-trideoxy-beta-L-altropyranose hydrolase [Bradyrhizobium sp. 146]|uniref:UDP-2,4-diacetamido-2,4, 6-trideoxy-beta-L-altropyranose hydrolase n=1 Tax=Bradyrhizobium sp. 146 TaxID=2782622 RepID=UPI001FFB461F|nr:UDP-2,4-diacetamido-2,4,6-trideoxy-beta-L-altropyranose hydrolase [Bradyrhizobium sp. 146]MCK1707602.1 UDP-2,4-diacetamido-2,4,6-trideoxy-beta-L-altropyranose hydrolase [Bradyrhizobium sp. 146]
MLIVFRADADPVIGGGHVMRCLTLATEMQRRGADVLFICSPGTADVVPALARSGAAWFEADERDWNTALMEDKLTGTPIDLIVVDSYRLGEPFERSLRQYTRRILVIDDAPTRSHDCDLLLDTTLDRSADEYAGLVPKHCCVLAGASYTLVRSAFAELRATCLEQRNASSQLTSVFVSLGLTDVGGRTAAIVRSLVTLDNLSRIIVVVNPAAPSFDEIIALQKADDRVEVHVDPPEMAELMASAHVAIGTPGTSSWERCCLGLPSVLIIVADNQRDNAGALQRAGAARIVPIDADLPEAVSGILRELALRPDELGRISRLAADVCDGGGAPRVGAIIDKLLRPERAAELKLRRATANDARRLWLWRNDSDARAMSGDSQPVPWDAHSAWLSKRLVDPNTLILIIELDGRPCGNVRFHIELTGTAIISIAMAPYIRGMGYGATALVLACREAFRQRFCECIQARVKRGNLASQRIFLKGGFLPAGEDTELLIYNLPAPAAAQEDCSTVGQ